MTKDNVIKLNSKNKTAKAPYIATATAEQLDYTNEIYSYLQKIDNKFDNNFNTINNRLDDLASSQKYGTLKISDTKTNNRMIEYNKSRILSLHYKKYGKLNIDGGNRYWCYIPTGNGGKKVLRRTRLEDIEKVILSLEEYKDLKARLHSFKDIYYEWVEYSKELDLLRGNTTHRYETDYKRFFTNNKVNKYVAKLEMQPIDKLNINDLELFLSGCVNGLDEKKITLSKKAFEGLWSTLNGMFSYAIRNNLIEKNPLHFIDKRKFLRKCKGRSYEQQNNIIMNDDLKELLKVIKESHLKEDKTEYKLQVEVKVYAVELIAYTGLRPAEVSALKWSNIHLEKSPKDGYYGKMVIQYSMKEAEKGYKLEETKTGKIRTVPIDEKIKAILDNVKELGKRLKRKCEDFMFLEYRHKKIEPISPKSIGQCLDRLCETAQIKHISPTTLRKSVNTRMKLNGVSSLICSSMLGNTPEVNDSYYTYDSMCTENDKIKALKIANLEL